MCKIYISIFQIDLDSVCLINKFHAHLQRFRLKLVDTYLNILKKHAFNCNTCVVNIGNLSG